jgi:hypothetical protein
MAIAQAGSPTASTVGENGSANYCCRKAMNCNNLMFSRHALTRMFERGLSTADIASVIHTGEVIQDYPEDKPHPSALMLGFNGQTPVHAVVAKEPITGTCYVVTAYVPDANLWTPDFRQRKKP